MATKKKQNKGTKSSPITTDISTSLGEMSQDVKVVAPEVSQQGNLIGKTFSLNQVMETFFGVGRFWLTPDNYTLTVPKDVKPSELVSISRAISQGILQEGDKYIAPITKNKDVLNEYWHLIKSKGLDTNDNKSESTIKFRALFRNGVDRNWTAKEVAKYCIKQETDYKNRERVLKLLQDMHKFSECPDTLLTDR
jgi:hypothetical protein